MRQWPWVRALQVRSRAESIEHGIRQRGEVDHGSRSGSRNARDASVCLKDWQIRILVVDDDSGIRRFVEKVLVREGHEVVLATNGVEAMRALDLSTFSVVLTDLVMPEADGLELLRQLRKRPSAPRVVAMSGGGRGPGAQYLDMAANLGAIATIQKPFTGVELVRVIQQLDG